jgi:hypothetical protein
MRLSNHRFPEDARKKLFDIFDISACRREEFSTCFESHRKYLSVNKTLFQTTERRGTLLLDHLT